MSIVISNGSRYGQLYYRAVAPTIVRFARSFISMTWFSF